MTSDFSFKAIDEGISTTSVTRNLVDDSVMMPDVSPSQMEFNARPIPTSLATGGSLVLSAVVDRPDALEVQWRVTSPRPNDNIRLYIHDRLHDENYLSFLPTNGKPEGRHIFSGLVRGYYDVRYFRDTSAVHTADIVVDVFCLGPIVPLDDITIERAPKRTITVRVPSALVEGPSDWLALFPADEHSNRVHRCAVSVVASQAKVMGANTVFTIKMPRASGKYDLRYFFGSSQSIQNGNAFSGHKQVEVPCEDVLTATYDVEKRSCTIAWKVYSVEPNKWQWIGLYDNRGQRLASEYVSSHIYTAAGKEEGVVCLKSLPREFNDWSDTGVMPSVIRSWRLRFYNTYFSEMITQPVMDVPFLK